jgi:hypothetical protein
MMNEKIKKLAVQAGGEFYEGFAGSPNAVRFMETDLEKFAESIVRECIAQVRKDENGPAYEAVGEIAAHFGIE